MKPYPSYKDSGVEWIGEIPNNWELRNGSFIGFYSKGKGIKKDEVVESGQPCIRYGEIYTKYELKTDSTFSYISDETTPNSVSVNSGTLLLTGSGETKEEIGKCIVYLGDEILWVGGDVIILKPIENVNPLFLSYLINSECIRIQREISGKGEIVVHIYSKNFKEMKYPLPSLHEQKQIVSFLDHKIQKIDELIEKTEKKIELLKEKRTSLINHCVTKGLNPKVKMKDSGVEWIGEIPKHWKVKKLKYVTNCLNNMRVPLSSEQRGEMKNPKYDYYGATGIIDKVDDYIYDETLILLAEDGANLVYRNLPLVYIAKGKYWVNNHAHILRPVESDIRYLANLLELSDYYPFITGAAQPKLTKENLLNISVIYPPINEQTTISEYLDEQTQKIDSTIEKETKRTELLKEYRQSLISEVVTGKIDVRDWKN